MGWPGSGKTELASRLEQELSVHRLDIDEIRRLCFGMPHPHPNQSEELKNLDVLEMRGGYTLLLSAATYTMTELKRSVIVTATFSRQSGQKHLLSAWQKTSGNLRVLWCYPTDDSPKAVAELFEARTFGDGGYLGTVNSPERYFEVKERFDVPTLPHQIIQTWPTQTVEEEVVLARKYIFSDQPHDPTT